jgi:hypothetical protein
MANGNDQWVVDGLPIDGDWESACGCAPSGPPTSTVANITITGAPGGVTSVVNDQALWAVQLNDGTPQADFAIQRFNGGALVDAPVTIERATGIVTFHDPVMLSEDPIEPMEAVTKEYVDTRGGVLSWNNRAGDITMTSTDVTVALGFAPYDAANPAGYQTASDVSSAINFAVPQPSNAYPQMDGVAAPGQTNQWARGDHVHPTDTSLLSLSGGTLTGNLFVPALVATSGIAGTSAGAPPLLFSDPPAADSSASVPTTRWVNAALAAHGGGSSVTIGDTAPASPKAGDLWWDSVGGQLYVWYTDANSSQWVVANNGGPPPVTDTRYHNRVINGDMSVDQRHGGSALPASVGMYAIDRWWWNSTLLSKGNIGQYLQAASDIAANNYLYRLNWTTTAASVVAATDFNIFSQSIEGYQFNDAQWGTANAQPIVLEFWAQASLTGLFAGALRNAALSRAYVFTFTISAANTWQKFRISIPGDQAGTWNVASNAAAVQLNFNLGSGATNSTAPNVWTAGNFVSATGAVNPVATLNASFSITGVALMVGAAAANAEPEFRKYSDNLIDCQRYFQPGLRILNGYALAGQNVGYSAPLAPQMRASPTVTTAGTNNSVNISGFSWSGTVNNVWTNGTATATGTVQVAANFAADADF